MYLFGLHNWAFEYETRNQYILIYVDYTDTFQSMDTIFSTENILIYKMIILKLINKLIKYHQKIRYLLYSFLNV